MPLKGIPAKLARVIHSPAWSLPESLFALVREGDAALVAEIISVFQDDTARRLGHLQQAFEAGDTGALRAQAHAIKGSAAQVGANSMATCAREIERRAAGNQTSSLAPLVGQLQRDFLDICQAMAGNHGV